MGTGRKRDNICTLLRGQLLSYLISCDRAPLLQRWKRQGPLHISEVQVVVKIRSHSSINFFAGYSTRGLGRSKKKKTFVCWCPESTTAERFKNRDQLFGLPRMRYPVAPFDSNRMHLRKYCGRAQRAGYNAKNKTPKRKTKFC